MNDIKKIKVQIKLASPKQIMEWSNGEVTDNDTLNYRTLKPEEGGLFCSKIFGPVNNYECLCGKYKGAHYEDVVCQKCGVKVANQIVRRENMGHIQLPVKVVHKWFFRTTNNKIALLLDLPTKELKKLVNLEKYFVFKTGASPFQENEFITETAYENYTSENIYDEEFYAETGAEALHKLLSDINLEQKVQELKQKLSNTSSIVIARKYNNVLALCKDMLKSGVRPEWMVLDKIPVLPVDLRPLEELNTGQFVSADINDLYKTIIYRSNRLRSMFAAEIRVRLITKNDQKALQDAVDSLFYNSSSTPNTKDSHENHKRSIDDRLKGKTGLMRSLLGKRVDFSARTVIVTAAFLKIDEVILPKEIVLELLTPALIGYLRTYGLANTTKQAKAIIERREEIWDILEEVIETKFPVVLLNRAPTLHRVSIMAFKIRLWDHKAIGLHPLVCGAFNADFDGDQMAIHLPLSEEAKAEALMLMMPSKNFGSVANTGLIVGAPKDIGFGLYCLTSLDTTYKAENKLFKSLRDIEFALMAAEKENDPEKKLTINSPITYEIGGVKYETTIGRVLFWDIIPKCSFKFDFVNKSITAKMAQSIMSMVRSDCGDEILTKFVDDVKDLGFRYSDHFTGSIGLNDLFEIEGAQSLLDDAIKRQIQYHKQQEDGLITYNEMRQRSVNLWSGITNKGNEMIRNALSKRAQDFGQSSGYVDKIIQSGARGSVEQLSQMLFMKGTIAGIDGKISTYPIWTGFKKGLTMYHYFQANRGSRRACTDVALKTAEAGYLTRRLVDVAHGAIINMDDCNTDEYLVLKNMFKNCVLHSMVFDRIVGRVCAKDIILDEKIIVNKNELITPEIAKKLKEHDITEVPVRSAALCSNIHGICAKCYGSDISTGKMVNFGEAVGVIAAQSIGEPATQLNMRAFHFGGIAKFGRAETEAKTPFGGRIKLFNQKFLKLTNGEIINISRDMRINVLNKNNMILAEFQIPYGAQVFVEKEDMISDNHTLASWNSDTPIIAEFDSKCKFINLILGVNCETVIDEATGTKNIAIIKHSLAAFAQIIGNSQETQFYLPEGTVLNVENNSDLEAGTVIGYTRHKVTNINIVGGLQSVVNILENREPKNQGLLSHIEGTVSIVKNKKKNIICIENSQEKRDYVIKDQGLVVQQGQNVKIGDRLTTGSFSMQDLLDTHGVNSLIETLCFDISNIYEQQGIKINDKHLEVIIRTMCCNHEVTNPGDSDLIMGQRLYIADVYNTNKELIKENKNPIETKIIIQGITDAALNSQSFLSSASFQETINTLVEAGLRGETDYLLGLKENIITGTLIPAGTGLAQKTFEAFSLSQITE